MQALRTPHGVRAQRALCGRHQSCSLFKGFKIFVYKEWSAQPQGERRDSYITHLTGREQIAAVAQLHTGSHWLVIDNEGVSRSLMHPGVMEET